MRTFHALLQSAKLQVGFLAILSPLSYRRVFLHSFVIDCSHIVHILYTFCTDIVSLSLSPLSYRWGGSSNSFATIVTMTIGGWVGFSFCQDIVHCVIVFVIVIMLSLLLSFFRVYSAYSVYSVNLYRRKYFFWHIKGRYH